MDELFWPGRVKKMYLSNDMQSTSDGGAAWAKYEMRPIDSFSHSPANEEADFISLQINEDHVSEFIPLIDGPGDTGTIGNENRSNQLEKTAFAEKEAYEKGFEQGEKDGLELGEAKANKMLKNLEALLDEISQLRSRLGKQYEKEILDLVYAIANKIIHTELSIKETVVKDTILSALELTAEKRNMTLKINPDDFDYVEKIRPELFSRYTNIKSLMITPDPAISRGGCLLETPGGDIDASIETQLESIHQSLKDAYMG
jgi:flagellar assembly protein FliH